MITRNGNVLGFNHTRDGGVCLHLGFGGPVFELDADKALELATQLAREAEKALDLQKALVTPLFPAFVRGGTQMPAGGVLDQALPAKRTLPTPPKWLGLPDAPFYGKVSRSDVNAARQATGEVNEDAKKFLGEFSEKEGGAS